LAASAAVLGKPIAHSLSPVLHRAAYRALGLTDWHYEAIECDEDELAGLLARSASDVVGYSCTMPLKREILRAADSISAEASAIGAGNTLLRIDDFWFADNTDWIGISQALSERGVPTTGSVVVLGAGGTAQAALAALEDAARITVLVREPARAAELLDAADRIDVPVSLSRLTDEQALLDVVYNPWPTALARAFAEAGGTVVSGASMLLHQAGRQVELMTGQPAPIPAMRAALLVAAPGCAA
jgi:shikimate dehydrogenase